MRSLKSRILLVFFVFAGVVTYGQQEALFSQYMFNKLAINPGYAGSQECLSVDALNRWQWVGMDGGPTTFSLSAHTPLQNESIAVGLDYINDAIGPLRTQEAMAGVAYRILFPTGKLSFGLQMGIRHSGVNWNWITLWDPDDELFYGQMKQKIVPDANFGVYYYGNNFYAGLSSKQLFQSKVLYVDDPNYTQDVRYNKLLRHFYGMAGAAFPISDNVVFRPSLLAKYVQNAPIQLDLNASFLFAETFWIGASYRTEQAVSAMIEFSSKKKFRIGYSYDFWFNDLQKYNKGSHEVRLGFDLDLFRSRMYTPRYF